MKKVLTIFGVLIEECAIRQIEEKNKS